MNGRPGGSETIATTGAPSPRAASAWRESSSGAPKREAPESSTEAGASLRW